MLSHCKNIKFFAYNPQTDIPLNFRLFKIQNFLRFDLKYETYDKTKIVWKMV